MKKIILLFSLLILALSADAQHKLIFEDTLSEAYVLKHVSAETANQQSMNNVLELLKSAPVTAQNGGRPNRKPEPVVRLKQYARISDVGDKLHLQLQLTSITVTGDISYKGFSLYTALLPARLSFTVKLLNAQNKEVQSYSQSISKLDKANITLIDATIPDTAVNQKYKLKLANQELIYTAESVAQLQNQLSLIKEYYAAHALLKETQQEVLLVQPDDLEHLAQHDQHLLRLEEQFAKLKSAPFAVKLNLREQDPLHYTKKIKALDTELQERRRAITYAMATLDLQFYNRGVELLNKGDLSAAQAQFVKSLEINAAFAPSHFQLARLDFLNGYMKEAANRVRSVLTVMRVDPETRELSLTLAHDIYTTFITRGNNHTSRKEYGSALDAYADARELCSTIGGLGCNMPALHDGEARAAYSFYRAKIEEGKRLLASHDYTNAERLVEEALTFQQAYDFVIPDAREAAGLQQQIKYFFYLQHIDKGKYYLTQKNYEAALNQFEAALNLERSYAFKPVAELREFAQNAAKPVLLVTLTEGFQQAMRNNLAGANEVAAVAQAMQSRYALDQDKEVQAKYTLLRERIFTQECINTQAAYDQHYQEAKELIKERKFLAADQAYKAAIAVSENNTACNVAIFTANDGREAILPAVAYQQMLEDINRFVASSRYTEAIQTYDKAEAHYLAYEVNRYGLDHISLFNYARKSSKLPFTATVANMYAGMGEEQVAIQLVAALLGKGYPRRKTKDLQEQIGRQLAAKDMKRNLLQDPEILAEQYTNRNKCLKKLARSYKKERKKLAKG